MLREASRSAWIASRKRSSQAPAMPVRPPPASSVCIAIAARWPPVRPAAAQQRRAQRRRIDPRARLHEIERPEDRLPLPALAEQPRQPRLAIVGRAFGAEPGQRGGEEIGRHRAGAAPAPATASSAAIRGSPAGAAWRAASGAPARSRSSAATPAPQASGRRIEPRQPHGIILASATRRPRAASPCRPRAAARRPQHSRVGAGQRGVERLHRLRPRSQTPAGGRRARPER